METQDGFIVGVDRYCDRWCERCPLTMRCRRFFGHASEFEFGDGTLPASSGDREWQRIRASLKEAGVGLASQDCAGADSRGWELPADIRQSTQPDPGRLRDAEILRSKIERARTSANTSIRFAVSTIEHFSVFVPMKMFRALTGAAHGQAKQGNSDANGSAKAALLGLERMRTAWTTLHQASQISEADTAPFLAEIASMTDRLERTLPRARTFVRPGFDEPEAFLKLEADERGRR